MVHKIADHSHLDSETMDRTDKPFFLHRRSFQVHKELHINIIEHDIILIIIRVAINFVIIMTQCVVCQYNSDVLYSLTLYNIARNIDGGCIIW